MNSNIAVVYEKGVLRPLRPLNLPERTQLEIRIIQTGERDITDAEKMHGVLLQAGLIQSSLPAEIEPVSEQERRQAADAYGQAGPLSDLIITDRDDA